MDAMTEISEILFAYKDAESVAEAVRWCEKAFEAGDTHALLTIGDRFEELEDHDSALKWYEKAYEHGNQIAIVRIAEIFQALERQKDAAVWYHKAIDEVNNPILSHSIRKAAEFFEEIGDTDTALKAYWKIGADEAAKYLRKMGQFEQAVQCYEQAIREEEQADSVDDYKVTEYKIGLAECFFESGAYQDALDVYRKLAEEHPEKMEYPLSIGDCLCRSGRMDEAMQVFQ